MSSRRGTIEAMHASNDPYAPARPPGQDELPCEDGQPMDTLRHRDQMIVLIDTLREAWNERHDFYVGGNMFVYFSELQTKGQAAFGETSRGPDVFVVLDTDRDRERKSWVAWEEGGRLPDVVIELLSPSTEEVDRGDKKWIYERVWRTGHYVLYDPHTHVLEGFERVRDRYVAIAPDARGDLFIASLGLSLGLRAGVYSTEHGTWLRWIGPDGEMLPTSAERADAAQARANAAEERVAQLEAALRARD